MKKFIVLFALFMVVIGCGYSSKDNESIGQPKKVVYKTPILCNDRVDVDVSLGVMVNGVGSMSSQDTWYTVKNEKDVETIKKANEAGAIVKITYDVKRLTFCWEDHIITKVEILNTKEDKK